MFDGLDHPNDYWPFEEDAGFCPTCRQFIGDKTCKKCNNKDLSQLELEEER
jgi:hypothetical protein